MTTRMWMAVVSLAGLFLGIYLTLYHYGFIGTLACNVSSCEQVQTSKWSMLLGLPVAMWGAGYYLVMLVLAIAGMQERYADSRGLSLAMLVLAGWSALFTAWLNFVEGFILHAWCEWCLGSASLVLLLLILAVLDFREQRAQVSS